jgi:hypothetical protein
MRELSIAEFVGFLSGAVVEIDKAEREALEKACVVVEDEAKRVLGTYDYGWPELAEATQTEREKQGYSANDPLLRTGELRDSIEHHVIDSREAEVGSNNDAAVYAELGTITEPPRPFLSGAAAHKGQEVADIIGEEVVKVLLGGRAVASVLRK